MKVFLCAGFATVAVLGFSAKASATFINFDDGQPNFTSVGSFYSGLGVTFTDASWTPSESFAGTSGAQGIMSTSADNFPQPSNPVGAVFAPDVSSVTLRGIDVGQNGFQLLAFDASDVMIDSQSVLGTQTGHNQFFDLTVTGAIHRIEFSQVRNVNGDDAILFDNLSFTPVPEPASMIALGTGALAFLRRRRK